MAKDGAGNLVAIKKFKPVQASLQSLNAQVEAMRRAQHPNLVRLLDCKLNAKYSKKCGLT